MVSQTYFHEQKLKYFCNKIVKYFNVTVPENENTRHDFVIQCGPCQ